MNGRGRGRDYEEELKEQGTSIKGERLEIELWQETVHEVELTGLCPFFF